MFRLDRNGNNFQVLHHFDSNGVAPQFPRGELVSGLNSLLYGSTAEGGTNDLGSIFRIGQDGSRFEVVRWLGSNAYTPYAGLIQGPASDGSGVLYGVTFTGVIDGTLFALIVNPPLEITPLAGQSAGQPVVFWPAWAINYQLQTTTNPATGPWEPATNGVLVTGFRPTNAAPAAFYRLVWPQ